MLNSRWALLPRQHTPAWLQAATLAGGIGLGLLLAIVILMANGVALSAIVQEFILYSFVNSRGFAQTVTAATPLLMVGLASAVSLKLRFWNIGVDGQVWLGAIAATGISLYDVGDPAIRLWLMAIAGFLAGAAWIGLPVLLRLRLGVNEVIATLMLTYVALLLLSYLMTGPWRDPAGYNFPESVMFPDAGTMPILVEGSRLHLGAVFALLAVLGGWVVMSKGLIGFQLKVVGVAPAAAARCGAFLHGEAGDLAAVEVGETALAASDIVEALPEAIGSLERKG